MISLVDKWTAVHLLLLHCICFLWNCGHYLIFARDRLVFGLLEEIAVLCEITGLWNVSFISVLI